MPPRWQLCVHGPHGSASNDRTPGHWSQRPSPHATVNPKRRSGTQPHFSGQVSKSCPTTGLLRIAVIAARRFGLLLLDHQLSGLVGDAADHVADMVEFFEQVERLVLHARRCGPDGA